MAVTKVMSLMHHIQSSLWQSIPGCKSPKLHLVLVSLMQLA